MFPLHCFEQTIDPMRFTIIVSSEGLLLNDERKLPLGKKEFSVAVLSGHSCPYDTYTRKHLGITQK